MVYPYLVYIGHGQSNQLMLVQDEYSEAYVNKELLIRDILALKNGINDTEIDKVMDVVEGLSYVRA